MRDLPSTRLNGGTLELEEQRAAEQRYRESGNVYDLLMARGFLKQSTHAEAVREQLGQPGLCFYTGFDPTADSMHVGHFLTLVAMRHLQDAGHRPIALMGGGTGYIGDPSGRQDLRRVLSSETIEANVEGLRRQLSLILDLSSPEKALVVNNADWILPLNYVEFLREVGAQFSVNRMLTAECYKQRMEKGLTFLEFNYMLLQAYDFLELYRRHNCRLELGGDDQWSNILAGVDLVRRKEQAEVEGLTVRLLTNSQGQKMGKTAQGAVWLDPNKLSPFDFYQYFRNVDDPDVIRMLKLLTFVPLEEIHEMEQWKDQQLNQAKARLAFECCSMVHGEEEARRAQRQAESLFGRGRSADMAQTSIQRSALGQQQILQSMLDAGMIPSKGEGRRLMQQGGVALGDELLKDPLRCWEEGDFQVGDEQGPPECILRRGKKIFHKFVLVD